MTSGVFIYGAPLGAGGLGMQAATALQSLSLLRGSFAVIGPSQLMAPGRHDISNIRWISKPRLSSNARILKGRAQYRSDCDFGRKLCADVLSLSPTVCYGFTQISLESAAWCKDHGLPFILDNPNGHIRNFRQVYQHESWRWCSSPYFGHPTEAMIARIESEYRLATKIRVSSRYSKETMVRAGVPADKIEVISQFVDLARFRRPAGPIFPSPVGPLRVCFVGSLDLRKGFVYLLRAIRKIGSEKVTLRIVGDTGDPWCKRLFMREARDLDVEVQAGDPVSVYHWAEVCVTPSLEDGFGFVVAEAMAAGVPVIVSDQCGAAEWVQDGASGWILPFENCREDLADRCELLVEHLQIALDDRHRLAEMGHAACEIASKAFKINTASLLTDWISKITSDEALRLNAALLNI